MPTEGTVCVVDDDADWRQSLAWLLRSVGLEVRAFASPDEFLRADSGDGDCLILDVRLPGMSGIKLYERLRAEGQTVPAIFLTGHADVPTAVRALQAGAVEFLEKPCDCQALLERVQRAIRHGRARRRREAQWRQAVEKFARLSPKEREVLDLLAAGKSNKVIAAQLAVTERAVEMRRAGLMRKLEVSSLAEMLEIAFYRRFAETGT